MCDYKYLVFYTVLVAETTCIMCTRLSQKSEKCNNQGSILSFCSRDILYHKLCHLTYLELFQK